MKVNCREERSLWIWMYALQKACFCYLCCLAQACTGIFVVNIFAIMQMLDKCRAGSRLLIYLPYMPDTAAQPASVFC